MKSLIDIKKLNQIIGDYRTGKEADAVKDPEILRQVRMRRRQLGRMMTALDRDAAKYRIPAGDYFISRKIDGEFTCLVYRNGKAFTINPGGTVRVGAAFHNEAAKKLKEAGVKSALMGGELYVNRPDGKRPWVHDVVRVARKPEDQAAVDSLGFGIFNIYDLDGKDLSMHYADAIKKIQAIFGKKGLVHSVETVVGDEKEIFKKFSEWVDEESAEGVVVRSDSAGIFKIKPRHTLDLAVVGFTEGIDDRAGMLHSILLAVIRKDGSFQIISRVGGGFSDEQRVEILKLLGPQVVESEYAEVNSDRIAYQMIKPGLVIEISCLDIISRTSHGSTIDRMIIEWDAKKKYWTGLRRLPLCSIISPQFLRIRDDKEANADDVKMSQLSDITEIPDLQRVADDLILPTSTAIERIVATKVLKEATMVRKILLWKTNKEEASRDHPAYVLHLTNYSPNRKNPLQHEIRVSSSEKQIKKLMGKWKEKYFVGGWQVVE
jgi:ATP-dependent DNA ligase